MSEDENETFFGSDNSIADPDFVEDQNNSSSSESNGASSYKSVHTGHNELSRQLRGANKILFGENFFKIVEKRTQTSYHRKMRGITAICMKCEKKVNGSLGVSSNFIYHLRKFHPMDLEKFREKKKKRRKKFGRHCTYNQDLLDFVSDTCSPLSIIENKSFIKVARDNVPSRRTITRLLDDGYESFVENVGGVLSKVEYICTTADIWSGGSRSFLGMTCHWLDSGDFTRKSAALACRVFKGTHSYDRIAELMTEIYGQFNLPQNKIVYTITDNGTNFVKAFEEFGISIDLSDPNGNDDDSLLFNYSELEFHPVSLRLSKHFRCASHTFNLLATTDFVKAMETCGNQQLQRLHSTSFYRCNEVWKKCKWHKSAEVIEEILGVKLFTPCPTRWNSVYDSLKRLLQFKSNLRLLCSKLGLIPFQESEIEYLEEYIVFMTPIAEAIDFMQGEKDMYFGYFIPTLVSVKVKMSRLNSAHLKYLHEINTQMLSSLHERFKKYFFLQSDCWDAIVASILLPSVKMRFVRIILETAETFTEDDIKKKLKNYAIQFYDSEERCEPMEVSSTPNSPFLDFGDEDAAQGHISTPGSLEEEISLYLCSPATNIECLNRYATLKKMFLKYNTPLPSSAPVERLFSFAGIVNNSRRHSLTSSHFEKLVLRKANASS